MQNSLITTFGVLFAVSENFGCLRIVYSLISSIIFHGFGNSVAADISGFPYCHDLSESKVPEQYSKETGTKPRQIQVSVVRF